MDILPIHFYHCLNIQSILRAIFRNLHFLLQSQILFLLGFFLILKFLFLHYLCVHWSTGGSRDLDLYAIRILRLYHAFVQKLQLIHLGFYLH